MTSEPDLTASDAIVGSAGTRYYDTGQHHLPAILLVHGTGGTMERHFRRITPLLTQKYRVVGLDLETQTDRELKLEDLVEQVAAVVAEAGLDDGAYISLGYSLGALVAASHAAQQRSAPGRLVLINGWVRADLHQHLRNAVWRGLFEEWSDELSRFTVFTGYSQNYINSLTPESLELLVSSARPDEARLRQMELNARADITSELPDITCPTLVVVGKYDMTVPPSQGRALARGIQRSTLETLPSGHGVLTEMPERVLSLIDRFVADLHA